MFVTNKPLETAGDYAAKLTRLGIPTGREDVISAVDALTCTSPAAPREHGS